MINNPIGNPYKNWPLGFEVFHRFIQSTVEELRKYKFSILLSIDWHLVDKKKNLDQ